MSKRYFSKESANGSSTSYGFSNDTIVRVFNSKKARDEYVKNSDNLSCEAIPFTDVTKYASNWSMTENKVKEPDSFSGEFWGIVNFDWDTPEGQIGTVEICQGGSYYDDNANPGFVERLYRR